MATTIVDPVAELDGWLEENWDPDLTVGEWWERLGLSGWAAPSLPEDWYGRGLSRVEATRVDRAIADFGAVGAPAGLGLMIAAPTIATHGAPHQRQLVEDIVTGRRAWCQLFSEPGAGSDLAGLQTRAVRDGDEWIVTGQKVWTSGGQVADRGMLLARTNPDAPKHQGITYFAFDMHQPGVEVRPLKELTGHALFNEVFITEARVSNDAVVGDVNNGWAVANTTLGFERANLGAGGGSGGGGLAVPGTVAGDLSRRVGDVAASRGQVRQRGGARATSSLALLSGIARANGKLADPLVRQDLARLHTLNEIGRYMALRQKALRAQGSDLPGAGNIAKLSMSKIQRLARDLGLRILGPAGTLHAYTDEAQQALDDAMGSPAASAATTAVTTLALFAQAPSIYGGTDEIQHNIIGERVLGLPKEPNNDRVTPFKDLPHNS